MRPHADVKLFRMPPNLNSKSVAVVKHKPENRVVQMETYQRKGNTNREYDSRLLMGQTPLAVAVVKGDSVFLTRVSESYEFRPRLKQTESQCKPPGKGAQNDASSDDEKVSAVTMRFASANEDDKRKARESLYSFHKEKIEREEWNEMDFVDDSTDRSKEVRASLGRI